MTLKTVRLQLRFLLPLVATLIAAAYLAAPLMDQVTLRWFSRDLNSRGVLVANALSDSLAEALMSNKAARLQPLFDRTSQDERLFAIGLCNAEGGLLQKTDRFPGNLSCAGALELSSHAEPTLALTGGQVLVGIHEVMGQRPEALRAVDPAPGVLPDEAIIALQTRPPSEPVQESPVLLGRLVLLHDLSFIDRRSQDTRRYLIGLIAALGFVIAVITVVVAQLSWRGWVNGARAIMRGEGLLSPLMPAPELAPFAADLRARLRDLEDEYRRSQGPEAEWTAERLRALLRTQLSGDQVIVVSNREPYIHECTEGVVVVKRPASGLVTAVEPVMRACSGTWIAHGSGSADREVVDARDRVLVPPGQDDYWLRRVWLTPEEEQGYYYGFANEGLWPLCHVAHVRPVFRESDWEAYRVVNQRFADAVIAEARGEDPVVLVQDYHFALLPAMIREKLPQATILTFWHIPWPNPESFGICPWRREILRGMLGSTILGFHTRFHCKNFIETVDRYLEARIEYEHSTITFRKEETLVESYPISIAWPPEIELIAKPVAQCRDDVRRAEGLPAEHLIGIGLDRLDYTKGIVERFRAIERLLESKPEWIGRFSFIQVAAPSRSGIDEYQHHEARVRALATRINERFGVGRRDSPPPIILKVEHHEPNEVYELYRAADFCFVSSLHDGMNLVAKEFIAARDDERGVLILSQFTGAARELPEAIIVNPYDIDQCAAALHLALTMPAADQRDRMRLMRGLVREFNVYRWAGRMLLDAATMRRRDRLVERPVAGAKPL